MAVRAFLTAALLILAGCGGATEATREVHLLAPAGYVEDGSTDPALDSVTPFERRTGCRLDVRVYDENEDIAAIARRRNTDAIAGTPETLKELGADVEVRTPYRRTKLSRVTLDGGVEITVPTKLASAFDGVVRPAGSRSVAWAIRKEGDNRDCAERWIDYVMSQ
jgi:spermidine/putrescine-binding protein